MRASGHLTRPPRVLVHDIENMPLSYWQPDRPTAYITAIASMWLGDHDSMRVDAITDPSDDDQYDAMLLAFKSRYDEADMVIGHYCTMHDEPIINGALMERSLPLLGPKLIHDTKVHMVRKADIPATLEYLMELFGITCPLGIPLGKFPMSQVKWRVANRFTPEGVALTKLRVTSDVHGNAHLWEYMKENGLLKPPKVWNPGSGFSEQSKGRRP